MNGEQSDAGCWDEDASLSGMFENVQCAKREWGSAADDLAELICVLDEDGCILHANRVPEHWNLGHMKTVAGLRFHALLHPSCTDAACPLKRLLRQAASSDPSHPAELETYDETLGRYILAKAFPAQNQDKVPQLTTVVVIRDVSERKRVELEAINEIDEAILAAQSSTEMARAVLSRIRRLVPYRWASVTLLDDGSGEGISLASDDTEAECMVTASGVPVTLEVPIRACDERIGSLNLARAAAPASAPIHEGFLCQVAARLGPAIHQARRYEALQQSHAELAESARLHEEMIQNVSHELRTPLAVLKGYATLLAECELGPLTDAQSEAVQILLAQGNRLQQMVDQLLLLQMIGSQPLEISECEPEIFLEQMARNWLPRMRNAGITLQVNACRDAPTFSCDQQLMQTVIDNLLENALKFSSRDSTITLSADRDGSELRLRVTDQGCGIPAAKLQRIFERFYQVDGKSTHNAGGMGIGLAICQKIVELHGGRIWAESKGEGRGSTFVVALPAGVAGDPDV